MSAAARVAGLSVRLPVSGGRSWVHAAHAVDLELHAGRVHALVGESGCGKSILASALIGLLPAGTQVILLAAAAPDFALVRDSDGRTGYVARTALAARQP